MSISVSWDNPEETILRWDFEPGWTWEDHDEAFDLSLKMLDEVDHPIVYIRNVQYASIPKSRSVLLVLTQILTNYSNRVRKVRGMIIVNPSPLGNSVARYARHMIPGLRIANSLEEARAISQDLLHFESAQ